MTHRDLGLDHFGQILKFPSYFRQLRRKINRLSTTRCPTPSRWIYKQSQFHKVLAIGKNRREDKHPSILPNKSAAGETSKYTKGDKRA